MCALAVFIAASADAQPATQDQSAPAPLAQPAQTTQAGAPNAVPAPMEHWAIDFSYWLTGVHPSLRGGAAAPDYENLDYPGKGKYTPDLAITLPVSKSTALVFSGFIAKGNSNTTAPQNLDLFSIGYAAGDYLTSSYTVKNFKLSLQDVLIPFPRKEGQKWRVKTLWEVQYASIRTTINAPFAPTTDSSGNPINNVATGSRDVIYPTFGLAGEYHLSKNLELQAYASGFTIPHHSTIGDVEGTLGYRIGVVELIAGGKYYHFKTSPQNAEYFKTTLWGPYVSLRFYPEKFSVPCPFCGGKSTTAKNGGAAGPSSSGAAGQNAPAAGRGSSTSSNSDYGNYVRRFSGGATLSVLGFSLIPNRTTTVANSSTVSTSYATHGASSRLGYGLTAQVMLTDHLGIAAEGLVRRMGYQLDTTVTTSVTTNGITSTSATSTHEDTRARLIDVPAMVRFYNRSRHAPGARWFVEGGGAFRDSMSIRTSLSSIDSSGIIACCTNNPTQPLHKAVEGITAGAGMLFIDPLGIRIIPEVRYTRWMNPIFDTFSTNMKRNEIAAGISISF